MIRLGLIGAGKWGKNYIEAVKEAGNCELAWVAGREWISQSKYVDGVIVATPPEARLNIVAEWQTRPMMVEKPLCLSVTDAELMRNMRAPGVSFLVNHQHLFSPKYEQIRTLVGMLGVQPRVIGRARGSEVRSYSLLWDYGPHFLAMAMGLGVKLEDVVLNLEVGEEKVFELIVECGAQHSKDRFFYNGRTQSPLALAVRAFAQAVADGGTDDWRFGVGMSVAITRDLERRSSLETQSNA